MFEIKMNARYIVHRGDIPLKKAYYEPKLMLFGAVVCFLLTAGLVAGNENLLSRYFPFSLPVMTAIALLAGTGFLYFYFSARLYFLAFVLHLADKEFSHPASLMKFTCVVKYGACLLFVRIIRLMWRCLFFAPSALIGLLIVRTFEIHGQMSVVTLLSLCAAFSALFVAGAVYYIFVQGRYTMCELLFIRSPRQGIYGIIKSSVQIFSGNSACLTLLSIRKRMCFTLLGRCIYPLLLKDVFYGRKYKGRLKRGKAQYQSIPNAF